MKFFIAIILSIITITNTTVFAAKIPRETKPLNATEEQVCIVENIIGDILDAQNPVVSIKKNGTEIKIPINKNIAYINGKKTKLDGVTVYNGIKTYVPQSVIELVK